MYRRHRSDRSFAWRDANVKRTVILSRTSHELLRATSSEKENRYRRIISYLSNQQRYGNYTTFTLSYPSLNRKFLKQHTEFPFCRKRCRVSQWTDTIEPFPSFFDSSIPHTPPSFYPARYCQRVMPKNVERTYIDTYSSNLPQPST